MTENAGTLAATSFHAWKEKDFATLRSVLADDAPFRGPLGRADDAETCIRGWSKSRPSPPSNVSAALVFGACRRLKSLSVVRYPSQQCFIPCTHRVRRGVPHRHRIVRGAYHRDRAPQARGSRRRLCYQLELDDGNLLRQASGRQHSHMVLNLPHAGTAPVRRHE